VSAKGTRQAPRAAAERPALDEASIVDAALELLRRGGVQGLSMRSLTERLGVAVGATYRHVRGKDELLEACARRLYDQVADQRRPADADPLEWLRNVIIGLIEVMGNYPGMAPWVVQRGQWDTTRLAPIVSEALAASGMAEDDRRRTMHVLFFFIQGVLLADYRRVMLSVGVADYAEQLRQDIDYLLAPRSRRR
jgi:AcrR family transcriptional regulator